MNDPRISIFHQGFASIQEIPQLNSRQPEVGQQLFLVGPRNPSAQTSIPNSRSLFHSHASPNLRLSVPLGLREISFLDRTGARRVGNQPSVRGGE